MIAFKNKSWGVKKDALFYLLLVIYYIDYSAVVASIEASWESNHTYIKIWKTYLSIFAIWGANPFVNICLL